MKHALFVSFHYPPEASSSGVLRTLKYTRYLLDYGWRVTVLAPKESAYEVTDEKLCEQIPRKVRVIRTRFLNVKWHLSFRGIYPAICAVPDTWIGWLPWGVAAGKRLFREDPYDLLYSTSPHATVHVIALKLAQYSRKPWVTDFRDPWYEDPPEPGAPQGRIYRWANRMLERKVIRRCSRVIASTTQLRELLQQRYVDEPAQKFQAILNGYDDADFKSVRPQEPTGQDRFVILHAGSINPEFRDPRPLFAAIRESADRGHIDLQKVRVRFVGPGKYGDSDELRQVVKALCLEQVVEFVPRVPYEESIAELSRASLLLLLQASPDTASLVPAKLYEYLRTYRPVLALVYPGASADVLSITGGGWAVDPNDAARLREVVSNAYRLWLESDLDAIKAREDVLRRFDRRSLAGELAGVFNELVP